MTTGNSSDILFSNWALWTLHCYRHAWTKSESRVGQAHSPSLSVHPFTREATAFAEWRTGTFIGCTLVTFNFQQMECHTHQSLLADIVINFSGRQINSGLYAAIGWGRGGYSCTPAAAFWMMCPLLLQSLSSLLTFMKCQFKKKFAEREIFQRTRT